MRRLFRISAVLVTIVLACGPAYGQAVALGQDIYEAGGQGEAVWKAQVAPTYEFMQIDGDDIDEGEGIGLELRMPSLNNNNANVAGLGLLFIFGKLRYMDWDGASSGSLTGADGYSLGVGIGAEKRFDNATTNNGKLRLSLLYGLYLIWSHLDGDGVSWSPVSQQQNQQQQQQNHQNALAAANTDGGSDGQLGVGFFVGPRIELIYSGLGFELGYAGELYAGDFDVGNDVGDLMQAGQLRASVNLRF